MENLKEIIYKGINSVSFPIVDNPAVVPKNVYPYGIFKVTHIQHSKRKNYSQDRWVFQLDIFSTYKGDKELLEKYYEITDALDKLREDNDKIIALEDNINIMDDKEKGPVQKHGVIMIQAIIMTDDI